MAGESDNNDAGGVQRTPEEIAVDLDGLDALEHELALRAAGMETTPNAGEGEIDYDLEAGRKGWVPKDKFKGPEGKWVDAKTFVQRGERFASNLLREVSELKAQVASFEGTKKAFKQFHEETVARKDAEIREAITALRHQKVLATQDGDVDEVIALEDQIEGLAAQRTKLKEIPAEQTPAAKESAAGITDPVLDEWIEDGNDWFKTDKAMANYALTLGDELIKTGETARGRAFLDKVRRRMEEEFPRKFRTAANGLGGRQNPVEGAGGGSSPASGGKTERDLPAEDLALMKQFIADGYVTKDAFLKSYFSR